MRRLSILILTFASLLFVVLFQNCQPRKLESNASQSSFRDLYQISDSGIPEAAASLAASPLTPTLVTLTWDLPSQSITSVEIERSDSIDGPFVSIATISENATSFNDSGLMSATTYYYRVTLVNASGVSPYSTIVSVTTPEAVMLPEPLPPSPEPTPLPEPIPPSPGPTPLPEPIPPSPEPTPLPEPIPSPSGSEDSGSSPPVEQEPSPEPPTSGSEPSYVSPDYISSPTEFVARTVSSSQIDLSWKDNANNESGYIVEMAGNGSNFKIIVTLPSNASSFSVTGLAPGTRYYFKVYAFGSSNENSSFAYTKSTTNLND